MDALTLGDAGSRGQRCERFPLLLLLLDKEGGESGDEARGAGAAGGAGRGYGGYGVADGAGGGGGGYRRFDHEGGRGGERVARGAAALLGSWPRHLTLALVASLAVGFTLLAFVMLSAWLGPPVAPRERVSRHCASGACGQVSPRLQLDVDSDLRLQLDVALAPDDAELDALYDAEDPSGLEVTVYRVDDSVAAPLSETDPASPVQLAVSAGVEPVRDPLDNLEQDPPSIITSNDPLLRSHDRFVQEFISGPSQDVLESAMGLLLADADRAVESPLEFHHDSERLPPSLSTILIQSELEKRDENPVFPSALMSSSGSAIDLILQATVDQVFDSALDSGDERDPYDSPVQSDFDSLRKLMDNGTMDTSVNSTSKETLGTSDDSVLLDDLIVLADRAQRALGSLLDHAGDPLADVDVDYDIDRSPPSINSSDNKLSSSWAENSDVDTSKNLGMKLDYRTDDSTVDTHSMSGGDSAINDILSDMQRTIDRAMDTIDSVLHSDSFKAFDFDHNIDLTPNPNINLKERSPVHTPSKHSLISDLETDSKTLSDPVVDSVIDMTLNEALDSKNPINFKGENIILIGDSDPEPNVASTIMVRRPFQEEVMPKFHLPSPFSNVISYHPNSQEISLLTLHSPWSRVIRHRQASMNDPLTALFTDSELFNKESKKQQSSTQNSPNLILQSVSNAQIAKSHIDPVITFLDPKIEETIFYPSASIAGYSQFSDTDSRTKNVNLATFFPILNSHSTSELDSFDNHMANKKASYPSQPLPRYSNDLFESTESIMLPLLSNIARKIAGDLTDVQSDVPLRLQSALYGSSGDTLPFSVEIPEQQGEDFKSIALFERAHPVFDTSKETLKLKRHNSHFSEDPSQRGNEASNPLTFLTFSLSRDIVPKPLTQTPKSTTKFVASPPESLERTCTCRNGNNLPNPRRFFYVSPNDRTLSHFRTYDVHQEFPAPPIGRMVCPCQKCTSLQSVPSRNHYPSVPSMLPGVHTQPFHLRNVNSRSTCTCGCMNSRGSSAWPQQVPCQIHCPPSLLNNFHPRQVEMVSVDKIGPRRCYLMHTTTSIKPQSYPLKKNERPWSKRRFAGHVDPDAKASPALDQTSETESVAGAIMKRGEGFDPWEPTATALGSPWEPETVAPVTPANAARPDRPVFFVVADGDPLTREQVCAFEAAARFYPRAPVHVLVLTPHGHASATHWPTRRDAQSTAAATLHAVLRRYPEAIQVVAVGEEMFSRSPLRPLWERAHGASSSSSTSSSTTSTSTPADEDEVAGEDEGASEVRFGAALRLGARLLALWEYGGVALDPSVITLRKISASDLHPLKEYTDAVRLDTKEALVLGVSEVCHPLVFELLRALAAEPGAEERASSQGGLLRRALAHALPAFCRGPLCRSSTPALEVGDDGALAVRVRCAAAAPVPERLLCRARTPPPPGSPCAWARATRHDRHTLAQLCPVAAAATATAP